MAKLNKQCYFTSKGEKKVNCYHALIPKETLEKTNIKEDDEIEIKAENNKIIVQKKGE